MRLGKLFNVDRARARRVAAGAAAMAAGAVTFTGVHPQIGNASPGGETVATVLAGAIPSPTAAEAATARAAEAAAAAAQAAAAEEAAAVAAAAAAAEAAAVEETAAVAAAAALAAQAATTTTTAPEPPPPAAPTAPAGRDPAAAGPSRQEQAEAIADSSGWNWRAAGVRITVAFHPQECCHWGVYDSPSRTLYIGPTAFGAESRLRYVVLHELAHAWQYQTGRFRELIDDYKPYGMTTPSAALEAGGDCIAAIWGATEKHYWTCPAEARATAARRLAGDWL